MGRPKAALPFGRSTLLAHQVSRLAENFQEVFVLAKSAPAFDVGPARVLLDETLQTAAIHGLIAALGQVSDHLFVLAVDLPVLARAVIEEIARRGLATQACALLPRADGRLQPLAAVWRHGVLPLARERVARGELSLQGLAQEAGLEVLEEPDWLALDPSGNSFANVNTLEQWSAIRERG